MTKRKRYNSNLQSTYCADCEAASNHKPLEEILPKTKGKISSPYKSKVKQTFGELEAKAVIKKKCEGPDCYNNNPFEQDKGALSINAMYKTNCGDTPCHEFPSPGKGKCCDDPEHSGIYVEGCIEGDGTKCNPLRIKDDCLPTGDCDCPSGCTIIQKGCCDYELENIEFGNVCIEFTIEEYDFTESIAPSITIIITNILNVSDTFFQIPLELRVYTKEELINEILDAYSTANNLSTCTEVDGGICFTIIKPTVRDMVIALPIPAEETVCGESYSISGNHTLFTTICNLQVFNYVCRFGTKFQIKANNAWVDVTENVITGNWYSECDYREITEWKILDSLNGIVQADLIEPISCEPDVEITKSVCEHIQDLYDALNNFTNCECDTQCTLEVGGCCVYEVEGIDLFANCFTVTFPEDLAFNIEGGGFTFFSVQANQFAFSNYPTLVNLEDGVTVGNTPTIQELLDALEANFNSQIFWNPTNPDVFTFERLPLGFKICYSGEEFLSTIRVTLSGANNQGFNPFQLDVNSQVYILGNIENLDLDVEFELNIPNNTFQVLINSEWINIPSEQIVNGTWTTTSCDTITEWRILDAEEQIVASGEVTATCEGGEETKSTCEWLQAHQIAIEELQNNPSTNPTLQSVTDEGNTTDNNIQFGAGAGVFFDNGSRVTEGTTNAGNGGNGGVAMRCSVDYELKWEAGRLYVMEQDGFSIREVSHNFNITPTVNDDDTLGYFVGSRWILDDGDTYICSDATTGAAVWNLEPSVPLTAIAWDANHTTATGNPYAIGDIVYYSGNIYRCIANNDAIIPTNGLYWVNLGAGNPLRTTPVDWNATTGDNQILNKPTIPDVSGFVPYVSATQDVDLGTYKLTADAIAFDLNPTNAPDNGQIAYDGASGALAYKMGTSEVLSRIGQSMHAYVHNAEGVQINKGQVVYLFEASGNKASVKLALNTSDATSAKTFGLAAENIAAGQNGFVITQGVLEGLNTGMFNPGDSLYLGATAGSLTSTKPYAPNHMVFVGIVERANNGNGQIYVKPQNGYELDELHDVDLITTPPANNDLLTYKTGTPNLWKAQSLGTLLGGTTSQYVRGDGTVATFPNFVQVVGIDATANALTGNVTNGIVASVLIPANTMTTNTIVEFEAFIRKVSATAVANMRVHINTANNMTGAQQLAFLQGASNNVTLKMERSFIVTSTGLTIFPQGVTANIDDQQSTTAVTNLTVDWTANQWLHLTANNASGETTTNIFLFVKKSAP